MEHARLRRPSPALVVSIVALVVALGGTSYAALNLPRNGVGTAQLKPGAVHTSDLASNSINSSKVINRSLLAGDFKAGQLPAGRRGPQGPKGDPCPASDPACKGPKGDTGAVPGVEGWHEIGAPGEPAFQGTWANFSANDTTTAGFYKDPFGVVHLKGAVTSGSQTIFTLPADYRPGHAVIEIAARGGAAVELDISSTGAVFLNSGSGVLSLDGVTWRAGE